MCTCMCVCVGVGLCVCVSVCVCDEDSVVLDCLQTFSVYGEVKGDSVECGGDDIEVGERGLEDRVLLGTGQSWQLQLQHNVSLLLRLEVSHTNVTTTQRERITNYGMSITTLVNDPRLLMLI